MDITESFRLLLVSLIAAGPALIFWGVIIVFAAAMLRRGGGRAERFLIAGAGMKILYNLLGILMVFFLPSLGDRGNGLGFAVSFSSGYMVFLNIVSMTGIILLLYAFWLKYQISKSGNTVPSIQERGSHDTPPEF